MKKILFITNIPAPYRIDFYNELGKYFDLTVLFEAKGASDQGIKFNWNYDKIVNFKAIFLSDGDIKERKVDWKIFKYLKKNEYDEIVVTNYSYFTEMAAIIYLKLFRVPYYMETDGGIIRDENLLKRIYKRFLVSGAKGYFSPSESSDEYLNFYGANKERIYRYPFTSLKEKDVLDKPVTEVEKKQLRKKLLVKEKYMILGVGQFIHRKGWDILIEASKALNSDYGIYIVGGTVGEKYKELASKTNTPIYFLEFKEKEELAEYYKSADLFVLPTREDIWGLVINEALAYSLPVITTNHCVAGVELIKNDENGRLVNSEDYNELANSIIDVIHSNTHKQMPVKALDSIRNHTIEKMAIVHKEMLM